MSQHATLDALTEAWTIAHFDEAVVCKVFGCVARTCQHMLAHVGSLPCCKIPALLSLLVMCQISALSKALKEVHTETHLPQDRPWDKLLMAFLAVNAE